MTVVYNTDVYIAIALAIEDFIPPYTTFSRPLSTIPLQFLVKVNNISPSVPCNQKPTLVSPTPADRDVISIVPGSTLDLEVRARAGAANSP